MVGIEDELSIVMKLVTFLLRASAVSGVAFFLGLVLSAYALAFFIATAGISFLSIAAFDYSDPRVTTRVAAPARNRRRYSLPLAA